MQNFEIFDNYTTPSLFDQIVIVQDPVDISNPAAGAGFKRRAQAVLVSSGRGGEVTGTLTFSENDDGVLIRGEINGLQPGNHGFHVHMDGNLGDGCNAAGSHFNPLNVRICCCRC